jgi:hypothetical protein
VILLVYYDNEDTAMPKPKSTITFQIPEHERGILTQYCDQELRTQSEVLREMVRSLKKKIRLNTTPFR